MVRTVVDSNPRYPKDNIDLFKKDNKNNRRNDGLGGGRKGGVRDSAFKIARKRSFDLLSKNPRIKNGINPKVGKFLMNREKPQGGLIKIGNSPFYKTPSGPKDPRDCNFYPNSIYCSLLPFDHKPIGIELSLVASDDRCNLGIQVDATFGFIKLPSSQIVYRSPGCINSPKPKPYNENRKTPVRFPIANDGFYILIGDSYFYEDGNLRHRFNFPIAMIESYTTTEMISIDVVPTFPNVRVKVKFKTFIEVNLEYARQFWGWGSMGDVENWLNNIPRVSKGSTRSFDGGDFDSYAKVKEEGEYLITVFFGLNGSYQGTVDSDGFDIYRGLGVSMLLASPDNIESLSNLYEEHSFLRGGDAYYYSYSVDTFPIEVPSKYESRQIEIEGSAETFYGIQYYGSMFGIDIKEKTYQVFHNALPTPKPVFEPPPPPPPPGCCNDMGCCPNIENNDQLLRLILKKIGSSDLPATVPVSLTDRSKGTRQINNLAEFVSYGVRQTDATSGKYPIDIKVKDADLTQEGQQEKKIKIPNAAEAQAEILGMLMVIRSEVAAILSASVKAMVEAGSAKQAAIVAGDYAKANSEYLGYKGKQITHQVPFTFKPGEVRLDKMLVDGEVQVKGFQNDDKDDIKDVFAPLLEMASMYRAANYRNVGTSDTKDFLKFLLGKSGIFNDLINDGINTSNKNTDPTKPEEKSKSSWDNFIEEAEGGFVAQPGITDNTNPYGRPFEERPKIREIGSDTSDVE